METLLRERARGNHHALVAREPDLHQRVHHVDVPGVHVRAPLLRPDRPQHPHLLGRPVGRKIVTDLIPCFQVMALKTSVIVMFQFFTNINSRENGC